MVFKILYHCIICKKKVCTGISVILSWSGLYKTFQYAVGSLLKSSNSTRIQSIFGFNRNEEKILSEDYGVKAVKAAAVSSRVA